MICPAQRAAGQHIEGIRQLVARATKAKAPCRIEVKHMSTPRLRENHVLCAAIMVDFNIFGIVTTRVEGLTVVTTVGPA